MKTASPEVDAYMAQVPEPGRSNLQQLREMIRAMIPQAEEVISYQIPTFKLQYGVVAFAAFKNHLSLFPMSYAVMEKFKDELKGYKTATSTIQFPLTECLPEPLVRKIVELRLVENEARILAAKKKKKK
jgi:uncharacterized protein YdhG (YjbR/CyaY superfamily)